jgi:hypothetical protein
MIKANLKAIKVTLMSRLHLIDQFRFASALSACADHHGGTMCIVGTNEDTVVAH